MDYLILEKLIHAGGIRVGKAEAREVRKESIKKEIKAVHDKYYGIYLVEYALNFVSYSHKISLVKLFFPYFLTANLSKFPEPR